MLNMVPSNFCARLRRSVNLILVSSVCPSVRMEQLDAHWKKIREILYWTPLLQYVGNIQISFKSDSNIGNFTWMTKYVCDNTSLNSSRVEKTSGKTMNRKSKQNKSNVYYIFNKIMAFTK